MRRVVSGPVLREIVSSLIDSENSYLYVNIISAEAPPEAHLVECVCELLSTIGVYLEQAACDDTMPAIFSTLERLRKSGEYERRIEFKIQDVIELRENKWRQNIATLRPKAQALIDVRTSSDVRR